MLETGYDVAREKGCGSERDREICMMRISGDMKKIFKFEPWFFIFLEFFIYIEFGALWIEVPMRSFG